MTAVTAKPRVRVGTDGAVRGAYVEGELVRPGKPSAAYMRGGASPFFFNWNPALRDQRDEVFSSYTMAAARAIDAMHNSGWLSGAVEQSIASTIGTGLRLAARPDREALGWDEDKANKWSETVERRWSLFADRPMECDAAGKMNMGQLTEAVLRAYYSHGEALSLLPFVRRPYSSAGTKVKLLPPHRMVQDTNTLTRMWQGVSVDVHGMPTSYRIRASDNTFSANVFGGWTDIRARDGAGRPQVIHLFEGREGQMRGITPLAPALRIVRQYDQLSDATLEFALLQKIFAATITSDGPTEEVLRALQSEDEQDGRSPGIDNMLGAQAAWYENSKIDLGGSSRITHLFPGNKLEFMRPDKSNGSYEAFAKFLLREVARCLGMTFETMTGDYSGATYSSVRMAGSEIWPIILRRRNNIAGRFCQTVYEAWLEEEIEKGSVPFDDGIYGFLRHRAAAVQANWRGPAKPQADDLKTAKAHELYVNLGVMSRERVADDLGYDWGDEAERIGREHAICLANHINPQPALTAPLVEDDAVPAPKKKTEDA